MENKIIRAVLYIRVSTEEQKRHGYSLDSQQKRLKEYCKEQGYKIVAIYKDEGKSARSKINHRKELLNLLESAKNEEFDRIIFWRLDRWFRNIADYYKVQEILEKHNIDWECSDEEYNTTTSNGRLHLNIKLSIAQNESDQTGDRIRFNFENMIKDKRPIHGASTYPFGLTIEGTGKDKRIVKEKDLEPIVLDMFDYFENCGSVRETVKYLNETYNLDKSYNTVYLALQNKLYCGIYRGVEDYCPAYISEERFNKIQSLVKKNIKGNNKKRDYIFVGLIKCPICGCNMGGCTHRITRKNKTGEVTKVYETMSYRCSKYRNSHLCTNAKVLNQCILEEWLIKNLEVELKKKIGSFDKISDNNSKKEVDRTTIINKNEAKLNRLNELYIEGKITKEKYDDDYKKFNDEIEKAKSYKIESRNLDKYQEILENINSLELYNQLDTNKKNIFWKSLIDYITFDIETKEPIVIFK